jgi:hypothetical protein
MKRPTSTINIIFMTSIFILACSSASLPSLATATPQTIITVPAMPTEFLTQPQTGITPTGRGLENENLLAEVPTGFKIDYEGRENNFFISEMVLEGESVNNWTTLITVEIFYGEKNTTPEQYQQTLTERWFGACENSETYPVANGEENGYKFVLWQLYCPLNQSTQTLEYTFLKAIQGNDSFYLVQVAFKHEPSEAEITQWMNYFKEVQVCDTRIPERACP